FLRPVLEHFDRNGFDVHCHSNGEEADSIVTGFRSLGAVWRNISRVEEPRCAEMIREDEIDILVDLAGHTERNRLAVFARHPAPVQVTWMGYLNTTGLRAMDYRI